MLNLELVMLWVSIVLTFLFGFNILDFARLGKKKLTLNESSLGKKAQNKCRNKISNEWPNWCWNCKRTSTRMRPVASDYAVIQIDIIWWYKIYFWRRDETPGWENKSDAFVLIEKKFLFRRNQNAYCFRWFRFIRGDGNSDRSRTTLITISLITEQSAIHMSYQEDDSLRLDNCLAPQLHILI